MDSGKQDQITAARPQRLNRPSLGGRALRLLTQRDHSRIELRRKLAPHAESPEALESLLDALERAGLLSEARFAASLVRRRAERYGLRRIELELGAHRLSRSITGPVLLGLREHERDRALQVWRKRFGRVAVDADERLRHQRFLARRGFGEDTIDWVMRHGATVFADG